MARCHARSAGKEKVTAPGPGLGTAGGESGAGAMGAEVVAAFRNHGVAVSSWPKNAIRLSATMVWPWADGCVPSDWNDEQAHVNPSARGESPSAQRYGPHESHGACTLPCAGSKFRLSMPAICASMSHFTAKPDSYAYGSGLRSLVA